MQPQIDFHILNDASGHKSLHYACQLIEKAYAEKKQVFVNAASQQEAERLDTLLWTFQDESFLPHQLGPGPHPISIACDTEPDGEKDILINLSPQVPPFYSRFRQVIEIVFSDPVVQQLARERYKHYRDQGLQINTIKS